MRFIVPPYLSNHTTPRMVAKSIEARCKFGNPSVNQTHLAWCQAPGQWQQGRHLVTISAIDDAELLREKAFLDADLAQECGGDECQRDQPAPFAQGDRRTEHRQQQAGVYRVAHPTQTARSGSVHGLASASPCCSSCGQARFGPRRSTRAPEQRAQDPARASRRRAARNARRAKPPARAA